jgi:hypothetical protein
MTSSLSLLREPRSRPAGLPDENLKPKSPVTIGNSRSVYWWCSPPNIGTANI